ncbi:DNA primase [uncultured Demequina sp.]|uniref:DNA primase n=1 Tax=uncultured Demequina sp. TaxID=693499 RepID=UPI0025DC7601|nr:DNA primase [uncultured Demequina sp.]
MAGTINRDDIAAVRERAPIEEIIGQHVALKSAGVGSLKGLCPFHDERSPSFNVRPAAGRWHCFGCGEGGDVIEFVMRMDGLPFAEAVEYLAERAGVTLRYEAGGGSRREGTAGQRKRLLEAHRIAAAYYAEQLASPEARIGRDFLRERGFDREAAETFGVGYAPQGWSHLTEHLQRSGFTIEELRASGLVSDGAKGVYDRFRGRLVWPIRDVTGEVIGFGARRLHEDDQGPKYLNTPETALYKKAQVLYGLDLAKQSIRGERTTVVVEGYTDVMACHLAGVTNAVATCGTAFGADHVKVVRRLMGDTGGPQTKVGETGAKVVFTFDGDEAGQNAALKSFQLDQQFLAQTFVAVDPDGKDPCDLRQAGGDAAVTELMGRRVPLFEFVIRASLGSHDLETAEGRVAALRAAAPVVAGIKDRALQPEYARRLAGWLGMEVSAVTRAVTEAARSRPAAPGEPAPATGAIPTAVEGPARVDRRDPVVRAEALSLGVLLQVPREVASDPTGRSVLASLGPEAYTVPQYRAVFEAVMATGRPADAGADWANDVAEQAGDTLASVISELSVTPLPHDKPETIGHWAGTVLARVMDLSLTRRIADLRGRMQRAGEGTDAAREAFTAMIGLETERRQLREG